VKLKEYLKKIEDDTAVVIITLSTLSILFIIGAIIRF